MRAAVTGGAGFIGHHLVHGLIARGHDVRIIDDFSTGRSSRLESSPPGATIVGSILDPLALDEALPGCDVVFHLAAIASVARSVAEPLLTNVVNVEGTIGVMLAAARHGVRRVVFASSSAVYGVPDQLPCHEDQRPDPRSPYGVSKLAAEHYVHTLGELHGIETAALRYFNVYGPGQDPGSEYAAVVPRFITAMLDGRRPTINGSAEITRDFVYVDDVVEANILASRGSTASRITCNIASGNATTLLDLLRAVGTAAGRTPDPTLGEPRPGDISASYADVARARQALGFSPRVPLEQGVARTMEWFAMAHPPPSV